jgi:hypothetical protein
MNCFLIHVAGAGSTPEYSSSNLTLPTSYRQFFRILQNRRSNLVRSQTNSSKLSQMKLRKTGETVVKLSTGFFRPVNTQYETMHARSHNVILCRWTGDVGINRRYVDPVLQIEEYLETVGVDKDQVGLVIGPRLTAENEAIQLEVNLRVLNDEEAVYATDGVYTSDNNWEKYLDEVYPRLIDRFEQQFPESQLQYYEPEFEL